MSPKTVGPALSSAAWERNWHDVALGLVYAELTSNPAHLTGDLEAVGECPPWLRMSWRSVNEAESISDRHALAALLHSDWPWQTAQRYSQ